MMWGLLSEDEFAEVMDALNKVGIEITNKQYEELKEILAV